MEVGTGLDWLLLWKYIIAGLTGLALEGRAFLAHQVWDSAWKRLTGKIQAKSVKLQLRVQRALSRGDEPPDVTKTTITAPFATFTERGYIVWDKKIVQEVEKLTKQ